MSGPRDPGPESWGGFPVVHRLVDARPRSRVVVSCTVQSVWAACWRGMRTCMVQVDDGTGRLALHFTGRDRVAGMSPGRMCQVEGTALPDRGGLVLWNPAYTLMADEPSGGDPGPKGWQG